MDNVEEAHLFSQSNSNMSPDFIQQEWATPSFYNLWQPLSSQENRNFFSIWESFYQLEQVEQRGKPQQEKLSPAPYYDFPDYIYDKPETINNLENLIKKILKDLAQISLPKTLSIALRDKEGIYRMALQLKGSIFVSEKEAQEQDLSKISKSWKDIINLIEAGKFVNLKEGCELIFPLPSRCGPLGFLYFIFDEPIDLNNQSSHTSKMNKLWTRIRKYGEALLQACIYTQLNSDLESGLLNGLRFHDDICREMALYRHGCHRTPAMQLLLIQIQKKTTAQIPNAKSEPFLFGHSLLSVFAFPYQCYRIGQAFFAVLGPSQESTQWQEWLTKFQTAIHAYSEAYSLQAGSAIMDTSWQDANDWFMAAQLQLEYF